MDIKKQYIDNGESILKVTTYEAKKKYNKMPSGYGIVQTEIMKLNISIQAKGLYAYFASMTGSKEYCFPSIKTIMNDLKLSEKLTYKYIKELKENNLIIVSKLYNDSRNNHKYEICYIDTPQNIQFQPVENQHVDNGEKEQFINNNSINNNNINNINIYENLFSDENLPVGDLKNNEEKKEKSGLLEKKIKPKKQEKLYEGFSIKTMSECIKDEIEYIISQIVKKEYYYSIIDFPIWINACKKIYELYPKFRIDDKKGKILLHIIAERCIDKKNKKVMFAPSGKTILSVLKEKSILEDKGFYYDD